MIRTGTEITQSQPKPDEANLLEEKIMYIKGTKHTKVNVEISPNQLCNAMEDCKEITLVRLVGMLANKMNAELNFNNKMYIDDGWWYLAKTDNYDHKMLPAKQHKASESEIAIRDAIDALGAVLVMSKLKGDNSED